MIQSTVCRDRWFYVTHTLVSDLPITCDSEFLFCDVLVLISLGTLPQPWEISPILFFNYSSMHAGSKIKDMEIIMDFVSIFCLF